MTKKQHVLILIFILILNSSILFYVHPLQGNLTYLGYILDQPFLFYTWGISSALSFGYFTRQVLYKLQMHHRWMIVLLWLCCSLMIISLFIPYQPQTSILLANWHVRIAMLSTTMYILYFFYILYYAFQHQFLFFQKYSPIYTSFIAFLAYFFLIYGSVCTLLEVGFVICMNLLFYDMLQKQ